MNFNSHPHEEDDETEPKRSRLRTISTHILTKRMTWCVKIFLLCYFYFNSHPHEEDDVRDPSIDSPFYHFNSHPHEEDDDYAKRVTDLVAISTHILTKRMTVHNQGGEN